MEYRRRILPWILMILGAVMALSAMLMLLQTPNVLQYTTLAPEAGEANATINETLDKARDVIEAQRSNFRAMALGGGTGSAEPNSFTTRPSSSMTTAVPCCSSNSLMRRPCFINRG